MSTITYLTSLVQQAIQRLNNYEANAKKVDELPHQTTLEPSSKIPVSRAGISEHLTVQQIISSIQNSNYNQLLAIGTISVSGTDITVPSGVSGQINGLLYGTSTDTILSITLCPTGFSRKDIIVLTTANTVVVISGEETDGAIVLAPPVPTDAVYITEFDVNDSSIGIPVDPIVGNQFVKKTDFNPYNSNVTGTDAIIPLNPNGYSEIRLNNPDLISISGYDLSLITGISTAEVPYNGKPYVIRNLTGNSIIIKNEDYANSSNPFYLTGGEDLEFPNNQAIYVSYDSAGFNELFKSWISGKQNIVKSVSTDTTAVKDEFYHVVADIIFTDPATAEEKDHYSVVCVNGTATIGGVVYPIGSYVVRSYIGGVWSSKVIGEKQTSRVVTQENNVTHTIPILTGTIGIVKIKDFVLPANSVPANGLLTISAFVKISASTNYKYFYMNFNSINVNLNILMNYQHLRTNGSLDYYQLIVNIPIVNSVLMPNKVSNSIYVNGGLYSEIPIDTTIDNNVAFFGDLRVATDFIELKSITIEAKSL